jgi:hypothetical protein
MASKHLILLNRNWITETQVASEFSNFDIIEQSSNLLMNNFNTSLLVE